MIGKFIGLVLSNFTITLLIVGALFSLVSLARKPRPLVSGVALEAFFSYYLLFSIGISFLYNFVMHVFFAEMCARFIGWANSPFQYEVGYASLGFAVVGLLAFRGDAGLRLAAVLGPALFLWGAAGGHVYQMVMAHNFAPGNAGAIFWSDIFIPVIGLTMLYLQSREGSFVKTEK